MIGDFDDNANPMWSLHLGEANSHDEARINSLKDDMDSVLIFVRVVVPPPFSSPSSCTVVQAGLFSAALTSFLIDSASNLQADPAQQMVFYQQQNVALLAQISKQISSITPQVSILSTPLPSYDFSPSASDVRVNSFWFMSLVFSLSAALLATLVQQWVRDYMHVFQRFSSPLKIARLRQYLYEGVEGWYMPMVARSVPGLVHISLFLFFVGLGDSLLAAYTTVAVTTIIPIAICGLLYVSSMFSPILNPQSPFRNPFSGLIWYLKQRVHPRRYLDRASGGSLKAVSSNMSEGQMQLAMEENDERKGRDVRAIQWLIHNRTEDDEMESFVMAIPGAFTSKWGIDIWRTVSEVHQYQDANSRSNNPTARSWSNADLPMSILPHHSPPSQHTCHPLSLLHPLGRVIGIRSADGTPRDVMVTRLMPRIPSGDHAPHSLHAHADPAIYDLCERVRHLVQTCNNHSLFANQGLWLKRTRGCVETVASLVVCADINLELFGDLGKLLSQIQISGAFVSDGNLLLAPGSDGLFLARYECLSFVIVSQTLANNDRMQSNARVAINRLSRFRGEDGSQQSINGDDDDEDDGDDANALRNAQRIDEYFESARQFCVYDLRKAFRPSEVEATEEQVREVLARDYEAKINMLERIVLAADHVANIDGAILDINQFIHNHTNGLPSVLRGAHFEKYEQMEPIQPIQFFGSTDHRPAFLPQFVFLRQRLRLLCSYSPKLRDVIDKRGNGAYEEILESLETLWGESDKRCWSGIRRRRLMERQLWRLQDLRDGGGFGFWVEFLFLVVQQLLNIPLSSDAHSPLILGMFRAVTSNWRQHKHSIGTQRVILNLICDMAILGRGLLSNNYFPTYITDELLVLLEKMVEGQFGSHIDEALKELEDGTEEQEGVQERVVDSVTLFKAEAIKVISRSQVFVPAS